MKYPKIIFMRTPQKHGGPGSFQSRLEDYLKEKSINFDYFKNVKNTNSNSSTQVICIFSSTKNLFWVFLQKLKGSKIIIRLDGLNWEYKYLKIPLKKKIYAIIDNFITFIIINLFSTDVIFQSNFVKREWGKWIIKKKRTHVIYNGFNFSEHNEYSEKKNSNYQFLVAEGELSSPISIKILNSINYNVDVYGKCNKNFISKIHNTKIKFMGVVPRNEMNFIFKRYKALLSLEVCPACPNAVIEAQSNGLPILCYETGSISEIVHPYLNPILDYGANPKKYEYPRLDQINLIAGYLIQNFKFNREIQEYSYQKFNMNIIGKEYCKVFFGKSIER